MVPGCWLDPSNRRCGSEFASARELTERRVHTYREEPREGTASVNPETRVRPGLLERRSLSIARSSLLMTS